MRTLAEMKSGKIILEAYAITQEGNVTHGITPSMAFDRTLMRHRRIVSDRLQFQLVVGEKTGPGTHFWQSKIKSHAATEPDILPRSSHDLINSSEIVLDPESEDTDNVLTNLGLRIYPSSDEDPSKMRIVRLQQPDIEDFLGGAGVERHPTAETRPLGTFSNWVVEELPELLAKIREGQPDIKERLLKEAERQLAGIDEDRVSDLLFNPYARETEIAGLDLSFLNFALLHCNLQPPDKLTDLLLRFDKDTGQPPSLTLEKLVSVNPLKSDARLFTTGDIASTELAFYLGISAIEERWGFAYEDFNSVRKLLAHDFLTAEEAAMAINRGTGSIRETVGIMRKFEQMNADHFRIFREYHTPHGERGDDDYEDGPSGAFSTLPALDILLGAEFLTKDVPGYYEFIDMNLLNFPLYTLDLLDEAVENNGGLSIPSIVHQAKSLGNPELLEATKAAWRAIREFRRMHFKTGRKSGTLPAVFTTKSESASTTSGGLMDPRSFLLANLSLTYDLDSESSENV